jgi:hypothetical protein
MRYRRRVRTLLIVVSIALAVPATACVITVQEPLKYAFKSAPVVFEGTLRHVERDGTLHFVVHKQWKGRPATEVAVPNPPTSCAHPDLIVGNRYVVVPNGDGGIHSGSHVEIASPDAKTAKLLDRRARWWSSPLSSLTLHALGRAVGSWLD